MTCVTQTIVTISDTMAFPPQNRAKRTKASASGSNISTGSNFSQGLSLLSYCPTEPIQGQNSGSSWGVEDQQYSHRGYHDASDFWSVPQENQSSQTRGQDSVSGPTQTEWSGNNVVAKFESQDMSRIPSEDSTGTHTAVNQYDQIRSRMYPVPSNGCFHLSSARSDIKGRSTSPENVALYTTTQMDAQDFNTFLGHDLTDTQDFFHKDSTTGTDSHMINQSIAGAIPNIYVTAGNESLVPSFPISMASEGTVVSEPLMYNSNVITNPGLQWENVADEFLESQASSPEDTWQVPNLLTSMTNSPPNYSSESLSPSYIQDPDLVDLPTYDIGDRNKRKPMGPRHSKVVGDLAANSRQQQQLGTTVTSDESIRMTGRSNLDDNNVARLHPLYQNISPRPDGLYHCPWEGQASCQHKPEKLKCNYDKFVDSHLKPYRCKVIACENLHFSSTACLLRHEREAHAMHGHGNKPFLCTYKECERAAANNGFPRHWNLRDHMRRVHNDRGSASPPPSGSSRGKKRKNDDKLESQPMEKTIKRIDTPPVVVHQPKEPTLTERYQQDYEKLISLVTQIHDPKDTRNMEMLQSTMECIQGMRNTSSRLNDIQLSKQQQQQTFGQQSG